MDGAETAEAREEFVHGCYIARDLRFQFAGICEFFLFAQAFPKTNLDAFCFELFGSVEQVRFDGQGSAVEGWTNANVGDGAAAFGFVVEKGASNVNAAGGEEFLLGCQIQSRHSKTMADARTGY